MNIKTKVISISIAVMMFIAMAAISVTAVNAATAAPATTEPTTLAATDATSSTQAAATVDSTTDSTVDSANGSIPTGDSNAALWAVAVVTAIVGATGVTCFAHARKRS